MISFPRHVFENKFLGTSFSSRNLLILEIIPGQKVIKVCIFLEIFQTYIIYVLKINVKNNSNFQYISALLKLYQLGFNSIFAPKRTLDPHQTRWVLWLHLKMWRKILCVPTDWRTRLTAQPRETVGPPPSRPRAQPHTSHSDYMFH